MICSELVAHDSWNASLQRPNHHTIWGQSLLILTAYAWNEERPSLLFLSRSEINTSFAIPFWAWIIFLSWKKSRLGSHPTLGGKRKFQWEKRNAMRKPKRHKSSRNSNARGHAQITRKSDSRNKINMSQPKQLQMANKSGKRR